MAEKTLDTLFYDTLRDIYYAERKAALEMVHRHSGVRPCGWTGSGGGFDRGAGVAVLELDGAEIAQGGV